jgi:hypothetical protein
MEARRRSWLWPILQIGGAAAALALLVWNFRHLELSATLSALAGVGPAVGWILVPIGVALLIDSVAWQSIFGALERRIPLMALYGIRLSSEAVLLSLSGGVVVSEGVGPVLLQRWGVPVAESVATVAVRKLLLVVSQTLYIGLGVALGFAFLKDTSTAVLGGPGLEWLMVAAVVILALASGAIMIGLLKGAPGSRLYTLLARIPSRRLGSWLIKHRDPFSALDQHFAIALGLKWTQLLGPTTLLLGAWIVETLETWLILRLLGVELSFIQVWAFEPALSLLRHLVFFVPAGLGFQDVGYVAFLKAAGVEDALGRGSAFVVLKRAKELFWAVLGLGLLALLGRRGKEVRA